MKTSFLSNTKNLSNKISPKEILFKYLSYWPLFLISILVFTTAAYLYIKYKTPEYVSSISIYLPNQEKSAGGGSNGSEMAGLNEIMLFNRSVNLSNEIQVLKTKSVMARVVNKLGLNIQYFKVEPFLKRELYKPIAVRASVTSIKDSMIGESIEIVKSNGSLFYIKGTSKQKIPADVDIKGTNASFHVAIDPKTLEEEEKYLIEWTPAIKVAGMLSDQLTIQQTQSDANILKLSLNTEVAEKGTDILNTLVTEYNLRNNEQKNRLVDHTLAFIDERMNLMRGELGKVEGSIQSYRQAQEIIAPEAQSASGLLELSDAKSNYENTDVKLKVINMVKQSVGNTNQPIPTTLGIDDDNLSALVQQYNQSYFQREEQLKTMPAANPAVRITQNQLDKLKSSILTSLNDISSSTDQQKNRYLGNYESSRARLRAVPVQERRLLEIGRQQDIKEKLFMFLLQKKEEAAITKASGLSLNSVPLDAAETVALLSPDRANASKLALLAAFLIPILIIYLRDLLNDKIITRTDIITKTSIPIIGEISHNEENSKRRLVVSFEDRTVVGEQFRILRANIPLILKSQNKKVILITSTTPAEGKTFCSLNLAAVYAIAGKKTVILEMDLRKPKIAQALNLAKNTKGITSYISDQAFLEELPVAVPEVENLYVVTAGIIPPNPSEILMDEKIDALFEFLKANFDFIIIDSAPIGLVVDAKLLAKHADGTLYVIRQRKTQKKQLHQIDELYEEGVFTNLSLLVNDVKNSGLDSYYSYGGNYMSTYKYSYGHEPKSIWQKAKTVIGL
jgi:tyrosine-protein kinase Etk/Wzc